MRVAALTAIGALLLSAPVLSPPAVGQEVAIPDSGTRIRVWTEPGRTSGYLVRITPDSIMLRRERTGPALAWPRGAVRRLEVSRGRKGHFWLGLGAGAVVGLVAGAAAADATSGEFAAGVVGLGVWLGGTVAGGVTGALIRTERWAPARWPPADPPHQ